MKRWLAAVASLALAAGASQEPSLAEVAAREKARRKAVQKEKGEGKSFTDDDLKPASGDKKKAATPAATGGDSGRPGVLASGRSQTGDGGAEAGGSADGDEPNGRSAGGAQGWARRAAELREKMATAEARIPVMEQRIGELRLDMNPSPADLQDPQRLQKRDAEIARLRQEIDKLHAEVEGLRQAYAALEEEARVKGIPPGWLEGRN